MGKEPYNIEINIFPRCDELAPKYFPTYNQRVSRMNDKMMKVAIFMCTFLSLIELLKDNNQSLNNRIDSSNNQIDSSKVCLEVL